MTTPTETRPAARLTTRELLTRPDTRRRLTDRPGQRYAARSGERTGLFALACRLREAYCFFSASPRS